mmetsp:Transcript_16450/g.20058  ORF Transcript_16450/g.20058 Transcript_16450/m.20058 type:complete len:810 (+) Transcript_16450:117-2546(+)
MKTSCIMRNLPDVLLMKNMASDIISTIEHGDNSSPPPQHEKDQKQQSPPLSIVLYHCGLLLNCYQVSSYNSINTIELREAFEALVQNSGTECKIALEDLSRALVCLLNKHGNSINGFGIGSPSGGSKRKNKRNKDNNSTGLTVEQQEALRSISGITTSSSTACRMLMIDHEGNDSPELCIKLISYYDESMTIDKNSNSDVNSYLSPEMKSCVHDAITHLVYDGVIQARGAILNSTTFGRSLSDDALLPKKNSPGAAANVFGMRDKRWDNLVVHSKRSPFDVYVGRDCKGLQGVTKIDARWCNPFKMGKGVSKEDVVRQHRDWVISQPSLVADIKKELRGKILGCSPQDYHGHTLAAIANSDDVNTINEVSDEENDLDEDEHLVRVMNALQTLLNESRACLGDVMASQLGKNETGRCLSWSEGIQAAFQDNEQRRYLLQSLQAAPTSVSLAAEASKLAATASSFQPKQLSISKQHPKLAQQARLSPGDLSIDQVRAVLPHLGEGYIEAALACYNSDVAQTLSALSSPNKDELHPRLIHLDPQLPKRKADKRKETYDTKADAKANEIQKSHMRAMEKSAENTAFLLSSAMEYNDDYDDQYDDLGGDFVAANDGGMYDLGNNDTYEKVKIYNQVSRQVETEGKFWEENRNTNRVQKAGPQSKKNKKKDDNDNTKADDDEGQDSDDEKGKKYRGPDKGKGGRLIGPDGKYLPRQKKGNRGGGGQQQQQQSSQAKKNQPNDSNSNKSSQAKKNQPNDSNSNNNSKGDAKAGTTSSDGKNANLTKIQKRRKNDNKSKVGNHHRKDRALKKTGGMM